MTNASKYTPAEGAIRVELRVDGDHALIEVSDSGVGIAEEVLPNLFNLFVQGPKSLDRPEGGLGIGLSVCKQLIEMQGGRVTAASEGVGHGSTFSIHLPLNKDEKTDGRGVASERGGSKRRILVVDDNEDAADSLTALLEIDGQESKAVYTPEAALEQVELMKPDVVLLDIGLPGMSGYEVAKRIKATHPSVYVIALSGYGSAEDKQRAAAAGFDEHLLKPVDFEVLTQLLNRSWSHIIPRVAT